MPHSLPGLAERMMLAISTELDSGCRGVVELGRVGLSEQRHGGQVTRDVVSGGLMAVSTFKFQ